MCLGLLLFVDWLRIQEWWAEHTISLAGEQPRAHERQVHRLAG